MSSAVCVSPVGVALVDKEEPVPFSSGTVFYVLATESLGGPEVGLCAALFLQVAGRPPLAGTCVLCRVTTDIYGTCKS